MFISHPNGHLPDPVGGDYLSFEDNLKPLLGSTAGTPDLRQYSRRRQDQTSSNSCVAQSVITAMEVLRLQAGKPHIDLSILALYFTCRQRMYPPETDKDRGTYIWLAADSIRKLGICTEIEWPWDLQKLYLNPGWNVFRTGSVNTIHSHYRITSTGEARVQEVIRALVAGHPVVFGTELGDNWKDYRKGQVLGPVQGQVHGSHATTLLGWTGSDFIGENSWGTGFGDNGFYLMSTDVIASPASQDFWAFAEGFENHLN